MLEFDADGGSGRDQAFADVPPAPSPDTLPLSMYRPRSKLRTTQTSVRSASVSAIDAHAHLGRWLTGGDWAVAAVEDLVELMDSVNVATVVNFDGRWGAELEANLDRYDRRYPERFLTYCHVNWAALQDPGLSRATLVEQLERSVRSGARGLKVWKDLGLSVRDSRGELVLPDDSRLADLWDAAGQLAIPIAIHTADPLAFFDPVDNRNERLEELMAHPEWSFASPGLPGFDRLMDALEAVVASHSTTTFIGVHAGCYAENLSWVGRMLDNYENFYIDIAARIAELGRQPRATRALVLRHPDRVLFGTDEMPPNRVAYETYFRFLESADESFNYSPDDPPPSGRWMISGIDLPANTLERVYAANAQQLLRMNDAVATGPSEPAATALGSFAR
jgi:predicted TIM-barrel fold metal-dependent hydrolase